MTNSFDSGSEYAFRSKFNVVDADAHFIEPLEDVAKYLDEPWRSKILDHPSGVKFIKSKMLPGSTGDREMSGRIMRSVASYRNNKITPEVIPEIMDFLDLDDIILISQDMLAAAQIGADDQRAEVLANGYVDYMLDQAVDPNDGVYISLPIPWQNPEAAVELIDRVGDEEGIVASCLVSAGPEPPLGDRRYDCIYEASQKKGLPIIIHGGGSGIDGFWLKGYKTFLETHTLGFLFNNQAQITSLLVQGVPEKFPDLDFVFQESGLFWIPGLMHRLDTGYLKRRSEAPLLKKLPSKYMQEFYYGTQPLEVPGEQKYLEQVIEMIGGPERLLFASDYPHWDFDRPNVITDLSFLTDDEKQMVLADNARRVFGI